MVNSGSLCYIIERNKQPYKEIQKYYTFIVTSNKRYDYIIEFINDNITLYEQLLVLVKQKTIDNNV